MNGPRAKHQMGKTADGRTVIVCHCGGGPAHEWRPNGGGARILACPSDAPALLVGKHPKRETGTSALHD